MYTLLFILALVAALLTLLAAVFTLGAIFSMATECHIFNKKSRFFVPKVLFFVLLIVVDALFFPVIGHKNWNLMLPLGIALVLLLSYYSWLWSNMVRRSGTYSSST